MQTPTTLGCTQPPPKLTFLVFEAHGREGRARLGRREWDGENGQERSTWKRSALPPGTPLGKSKSISQRAGISGFWAKTTSWREIGTKGCPLSSHGANSPHCHVCVSPHHLTSEPQTIHTYQRRPQRMLPHRVGEATAILKV